MYQNMNDNAQNKQPEAPPVVEIDKKPLIIEPMTEQQMSGFYYTGINVHLKLPLTVNSGDPLFAINTDGFIPIYNITSNDETTSTHPYASVHANMMPVQSFQTSRAIITIDLQYLPNYAQMNYYSNRFMSGSVGVGLRIISNVGQTGHLSISHATAVQRAYYQPLEVYDGLRFMNYPTNTFNQAISGYALLDISTNRNVRVTSVENNPNNVLDMYKKLKMIGFAPNLQTWDQYYKVMSNQFLEDWLIVGALSSIPNTNGEDLVISVYFDYSRVTFALPMFTTIPTVPQTAERQILRFSHSFDNKVINTITKAEASWYPGATLDTADKQYDKFEEEMLKIAAKFKAIKLQKAKEKETEN